MHGSMSTKCQLEQPMKVNESSKVSVIILQTVTSDTQSSIIDAFLRTTTHYPYPIRIREKLRISANIYPIYPRIHIRAPLVANLCGISFLARTWNEKKRLKRL